jgi:hypothetical protein
MLQRVPPDLLIVQDKSGSMMESPTGGGASKWTQVTNAVSTSLGTSQARQARWGLAFFPTDSACGSPTTPAVAVGAGTQNQIQLAFAITSPEGGTPTQATLRAMLTYLMSLQDQSPRFFVLATDGGPNCAGPLDTDDDTAGTVQAITDAKNMGVSTFVIGISSDAMTDSALNQMAMAGGEARPSGPPYYYAVANQQDFVNAIANITGTVVSCTFPLATRPPDVDLVTITAGGVTVPRDPAHMNGWDFGANDMSITLYGSSCAQIRNGTQSNVRAVFGCPPISIFSQGPGAPVDEPRRTE